MMGSITIGVVCDCLPISLLLYYHYRNFSEQAGHAKGKGDDSQHNSNNLSEYFLASAGRVSKGSDKHHSLMLKVRTETKQSICSEDDFWQNSDDGETTQVHFEEQ